MKSFNTMPCMHEARSWKSGTHPVRLGPSPRMITCVGDTTRSSRWCEITTRAPGAPRGPDGARSPCSSHVGAPYLHQPSISTGISLGDSATHF
jgi:hypothetical protein